MAIGHSKRYHQVNRAVFNAAGTAAVLGVLTVLLGLVEPQSVRPSVSSAS